MIELFLDEIESLLVTVTAQLAATAAAQAAGASHTRQFIYTILPTVGILFNPQYAIPVLLAVLYYVLFAAGSHKKAAMPPAPLVSNGSSLSIPHWTVIRGGVGLLTALTIHAVDYGQLFPWRFAKSTSYGASLMDTGVGIVVYVTGVGAGLRYRATGKPATVKQVALSIFPLLLLGCGRTLAVRAVGYPYAIGEYGLHWNFFMTLAALPLADLLFSQRALPRLLWALNGMLFYQQFVLANFEAWILDDAVARDSLFAQNKEGLLSLPGYIAIFLAGSCIGRRGVHRSRFLVVMTIVSGIAYGALRILVGWPASRRSANLSYVAWSLCFAGTHHLIVRALYPNSASKVPIIHEAISRNQLAFFLVANILTGLANMQFPLAAVKSPAVAVVGMTVYSAILVGFAVAARNRRIARV